MRWVNNAEPPAGGWDRMARWEIRTARGAWAVSAVGGLVLFIAWALTTGNTLLALGLGVAYGIAAGLFNTQRLRRRDGAIQGERH